MKKSTIIYSVVIALVLILAISLFVIQTNKPTEQLDVTIGYSALRISLPVFVAVEKGYFAEEGLNIKLERFNTAQPLMQALVAGTIDVAGYTALPIIYTSMIRGNKELYFVTAMMEDQEHPISFLLVGKNETSITKISDLKGKKIGILPTVAYQKWIEIILKENDVAVADVTITPIDPTLEASALQSGQIDALFTNDPVATTTLQKGISKKLVDGAIVPTYLGEPYIFGSFNIAKDYADDNPEVTRRIVSALDKAVKYINENPAEAKLVMTNYIAEAQKLFVEFYPDARYIQTSEVSEQEFIQNMQQALEQGIISSEVKLNGLIKTK